jgi:protein arginine kinase activator
MFQNSKSHKCMKCDQPATHRFTRMEKGQVIDLHFCEKHAAEYSPYQKPKPLQDILEHLLKQEYQHKASGPQAPPTLRCPSCDLPYDAYKKNLLLGCSECYRAFREYLIGDLRKFHGDTRHFGRKPGGGLARPPLKLLTPGELDRESAMAVPKGESSASAATVAVKDPRITLDELTRAMQEAIAREDYVKAARCRDQIRELKASLQRAADPAPPAEA